MVPIDTRSFNFRRSKICDCSGADGRRLIETKPRYQALDKTSYVDYELAMNGRYRVVCESGRGEGVG